MYKEIDNQLDMNMTNLDESVCDCENSFHDTHEEHAVSVCHFLHQSMDGGVVRARHLRCARNDAARAFADACLQRDVRQMTRKDYVSIPILTMKIHITQYSIHLVMK